MRSPKTLADTGSSTAIKLDIIPVNIHPVPVILLRFSTPLSTIIYESEPTIRSVFPVIRIVDLYFLAKALASSAIFPIFSASILSASPTSIPFA